MEREDKGTTLFGLSVFTLIGIGSLIFCIPAIVLLVLHFVLDNFSIWWFVGVVIAWVLYWIFLYLMVILGRWGARTEEEEKTRNPNVNPYSHVGPVETKKDSTKDK